MQALGPGTEVRYLAVALLDGALDLLDERVSDWRVPSILECGDELPGLHRPSSAVTNAKAAAAAATFRRTIRPTRRRAAATATRRIHALAASPSRRAACSTVFASSCASRAMQHNPRC